MTETSDLTNLMIILGAVLNPLVTLTNGIENRFHLSKWLMIPLSAAVSITILAISILVFGWVVSLLPDRFDQKPALDQSQSTEHTANVPDFLDSPVAFKQVAFSPQEETQEGDGELQVETRERKVDYGETNDHCAGARDVRWHFPAVNGWKIDTNSIEIGPTVVSSKSSYSGVVDESEDGFYVKGRIVNRGNCVKAFGTVIAKDARGTLRVAGTYRETRMVPATN